MKTKNFLIVSFLIFVSLNISIFANALIPERAYWRYSNTDEENDCYTLDYTYVDTVIGGADFPEEKELVNMLGNVSLQMTPENATSVANRSRTFDIVDVALDVNNETNDLELTIESSHKKLESYYCALFGELYFKNETLQIVNIELWNSTGYIYGEGVKLNVSQRITFLRLYDSNYTELNSWDTTVTNVNTTKEEYLTNRIELDLRKFTNEIDNNTNKISYNFLIMYFNISEVIQTDNTNVYVDFSTGDLLLSEEEIPEEIEEIDILDLFMDISWFVLLSLIIVGVVIIIRIKKGSKRKPKKPQLKSNRNI